MGEELARFMNEAQAYSQCLDATKQQLNSEVDQYMVSGGCAPRTFSLTA